MRRSTYTLVFAFGLSLTPACGDDEGDGESIESLCQKGCTISASLACPNDDASTCLSDCLEDAEATPEGCLSPAKVAVGCIVNRPASDWECDAEAGSATIKAGICAEESEALLACVFGDDGTCPFENDAECDDPTGTDLCAAGTDLADCT
jgi:hypothetical protein